MFVWKCVSRDRMGLFNFKYPAVGKMVHHKRPKGTVMGEETNFLHGCIAGGTNISRILYRPGGIWLILEVNHFLLGTWGDDHVMFKEGKVVAEFTKFSELLAHPAMKGQQGYIKKRGKKQYSINNMEIADEGVCQSWYCMGAFGPEGVKAEGKFLATGPGGYIELYGCRGYIGIDVDCNGYKLKPYTWYTLDAAYAWVVQIINI